MGAFRVLLPWIVRRPRHFKSPPSRPCRGQISILFGEIVSRRTPGYFTNVKEGTGMEFFFVVEREPFAHPKRSQRGDLLIHRSSRFLSTTCSCSCFRSPSPSPSLVFPVCTEKLDGYSHPNAIKHTLSAFATLGIRKHTHRIGILARFVLFSLIHVIVRFNSQIVTTFT